MTCLDPHSRHNERRPASQRGAALLAAMLTVALVATLAAGAMWQQWRSIEVESAERQRSQARWLLTGALDWARVILREDVRADNPSAPTDSLTEPWAVPLQEARLSSFLAAMPDGSVTTGNSSEDDNLAQNVFLSGQITDLQGRLNLTNVMKGDQSDATALAALARLFDALGLPPSQLNLLVQGLRAAQRKPANTSDTSTPLMPQRLAQLSWLGLSSASLKTLEPHLTLLPTPTPVNVNTASQHVLYASVPGLSMSEAQRLVQQRDRAPWTTLDEFAKAMGRPVELQNSHSVNTQFFEVLGRLRMSQTTLQERSLVKREQSNLTVMWREFGSLQ
jgi:general secretion pathway protein K